MASPLAGVNAKVVSAPGVMPTIGTFCMYGAVIFGGPQSIKSKLAQRCIQRRRRHRAGLCAALEQVVRKKAHVRRDAVGLMVSMAAKAADDGARRRRGERAGGAAVCPAARL